MPVSTPAAHSTFNAVRKLYVIGIGAGDPDQLTLQAIKAMNEAGVFFVIGKGEKSQELVDVRTRILDEHMRRAYRIVEVADPPRDRNPAAYRTEVDSWHRQRAQLLAREFDAVDETGAILVWGDPALYDSTLRLLELTPVTNPFDYEVIPGITSVQALAARHRLVLNDIGEPVVVTTGRRLREGGPIAHSTVVMLDQGTAFTSLPGETKIWWGAYLGLPDETLLSGTVAEIGPEIERTRARLRERKGWIMDTYLLRP